MLTQSLTPNKEKLKLKPIEINTTNLSAEQKDKKLDFIKNTPQVYYYNLELPAQGIKFLSIDSNAFLPTFELQFIDIYNIMQDNGFPVDNAIIRIVIPSNNDALANIFMEFKIRKYNVEIMRDGKTRKVYMWGVCNIENLLIKEYKAFKDSTSYDLIKQVAEESGLGFISNTTVSSDKMTWLNPGMNNYKFLQEVISKSWVGESGYVWGFVDMYYNINYIDVEKQLSQDINEIKWIPTNIVSDNKNETPKEAQPPVLTNSQYTTSSNTMFAGESITNKSTDISLDRGYLRNVHFYDIDGNWKEKGGAYKNYVLDTITTSGSESTTVYLKGDEGNLDFYNKNKSFHYMDKLDTKNMYPDYLWAKVQNEENIFDLQKISIGIILAIPNYNIKRFEKISLLFTYDNDNQAGKLVNKKLAGEWLVTGIKYEWNGNAIFQHVSLVKRELTNSDIQ